MELAYLRNKLAFRTHSNFRTRSELARGYLMRLRVFLTGCSGSVGKLLVELLLARGHEVRSSRFSGTCQIDNSLHSCEKIDLVNGDTRSIFKEFQPEILVHTAWITKPSNYWNSEENLLWANQSKYLIKNFETFGGKYAVVMGSCAEYSWNTTEPLSEISTERPTSKYGEAKLNLLNWLREGTLPYLWTRTFFQYGLSDSSGRLIPSVTRSLLMKEEFIVRGRSDVRDFVLDSDVAKVLDKLIEIRATGVVNVGTGTGVTIEELVEIAIGLIGDRGRVVYEDSSTRASKVIADTTKLNSLVGHFQWQDLKDSLQSVILGCRRRILETKP